MGQASGHVILAGGGAVVIDDGYKTGGRDTAKMIQNDVEGADPLYLIATHFHQDHASGLLLLADQLAVDALYLPAGVQSSGTRAALQSTVSSWNVVHGGPPSIQFSPRVEIEFLQPVANVTTSDLQTKDDGIVTRVRISPTSGNSKERSLLFLGDLTQFFQLNLKKRYVQSKLSADGVTLPHHGSKYNIGEHYQEVPNDVLAQIGVDREENSTSFRTDLDQALSTADLTEDTASHIRTPVFDRIAPDNVVISADPEHEHMFPDYAALLALYNLSKTPEVWATFRNQAITWEIAPDGSYEITPGDRRTNGRLDRLISSWLP